MGAGSLIRDRIPVTFTNDFIIVVINLLIVEIMIKKGFIFIQIVIAEKFCFFFGGGGSKRFVIFFVEPQIGRVTKRWDELFDSPYCLSHETILRIIHKLL